MTASNQEWGPLRELVEDLRQKAMFNESQRNYNVVAWQAVAFEQKRIADELEKLARKIEEEKRKAREDLLAAAQPAAAHPPIKPLTNFQRALVIADGLAQDGYITKDVLFDVKNTVTNILNEQDREDARAAAQW